MKKKCVYVVLVFFVGIAWVKAQCDTLPIRLPANLLTSSSELNQYYGQMMDSVLILTCSEYVLMPKDTTQREQYGRAGNTYYDRKYGVGIAVNNGVYFSTHLLQPWLQESSFKVYEDSLRPHLTRFDMAMFPYQTFTSIRNSHKKINEVSFAAMPSKWPNIPCWNAPFPKNGKLIPLFKSSDEGTERFVFEKVICSVTPVWEGDEARFPNHLKENKDLIGGFLVYQHISASTLRLEIGGILIDSNDQALRLKRIKPVPLTTIKSVRQTTNGF
jgi:hypothetical protein